jgi:hypothetical protein
MLSTVDVHWWMISNWSNLSIYFSLVVDWQDNSYLIFSICRGAKTISLGNIVLMWLLLETITCCCIDSKNRFWDENENLGK